MAAAPNTPAMKLPNSTDVIAATSIVPSMPRLMMPLRWTMTSPSTASSRGVEATMASRSASIACTEAPEGDQHENDGGLAERRHGRGDVRRALQLARTARQRAEKNRGEQRRQRMQLRQKSDRDSGVAVARGEALEESMRDGEQLEPAREAGHRTGNRHGARDLRVDVHAGPQRGERIQSCCAKSQAFFRSIEQQPRRDADGDRDHDLARGRQRDRDGIRLRILRILLLQRPVDRVPEEMDGDEVEKDGRQNFRCV